MNESNVIWWMIGACIVVTLCLVFSKQLKIIFKVLLNSIIGICGLFFGNLVLAPLGLTVGINVLTVLFIGVLGLPGLVALYLMQLILRNV